jgi:hypothetical protein
MKSRRALRVAAGLITTPLLGLPAWGAPCVPGSVASYVALGATGCSVDGVTFSNIAVNTLVSGGGTVTLGNFTPFQVIVNGVLESGLSLNYIANAGISGAETDVAWSYNVSGSLLSDAFMSFAGNTTGTGQAQISEVLSNGVTLSLNAPGSTTAMFAPVGSLFVLKDQADHANAGTASSSIIANAFSVTAVPGPMVGAGLPGLVVAGSGLLALARRRHRRRSA